MTLRTTPLASLAITLLLSFATCYAQAAVPDDIRALAASAKQAPPPGQRPYDERDWLDRFYAKRAYAPAWLDKGNAKATAAIALLHGAAAQGLSPSEYLADELDKQLHAAAHNDAELDVALTRAMLHYLADLRVGRVRSEYHSAPPDPRLKAFDPVEQLRTGLDENRLAAVAASAEPNITIYKRVKAALAHYRELALVPAVTLPAMAKGKKIEVDAAYPQAGTLRTLLQTLGDAPGAAPAQDDHYTTELAEAVKRFQARHGLLDDGVLGRDTITALNTPLSQRVRQLELTLERMRWLPEFTPGPVIAVNLPAFRLWAFDTSSSKAEPPLEMKVIVGTAVKTETPLFIGTMRYLEFNPYWNVPRSIEKAEMIPKLQKNPAYLTENDMEMVPVKGGGEPIQNVDAAALDGLRAGNYRVRQRPGPKNALGAVKFAMPNPDNIYLHSTSARELFKRTRRDLSHGCIRVEKPQELAQFVLAGKPDWDAEKIAAAMEPGESKTVTLKTPIPVVLFYTTAIADAEGHAIFSPDVYLRDPMLEKLLSAHSHAAAH